MHNISQTGTYSERFSEYLRVYLISGRSIFPRGHITHTRACAKVHTLTFSKLSSQSSLNPACVSRNIQLILAKYSMKQFYSVINIHAKGGVTLRSNALQLRRVINIHRTQRERDGVTASVVVGKSGATLPCGTTETIKKDNMSFAELRCTEFTHNNNNIGIKTGA